MAFFNPHTHPLLPQSFAATVGSDGIPEVSTEPSLSVVTDDTSSEDWVVSLNSAPISERAASTGPGSYVAVWRSGTHTPMSSSEYEAPTPAPLAFPQHNGSGSFNRERINEWRLDQSQLVLRELRRFEREREESSTPESVIASWSVGGDEHHDNKKASSHSSKGQNANINALWSLFARRVSGFMGITDEVQEIIAGERYLDSKKNDMVVQQQQPQLRHYNQALLATPGWETTLINKVFTELHIPRPFWQYFSFWFDKRNTAIATGSRGASSSLVAESASASAPSSSQYGHELRSS